MKTPREILLARHAAANHGLDALRHQVVAGLKQRNSAEAKSVASPAPGWRELFCPGPKPWAALAALWIVILGLHFTTRDNAPAQLAETPASPAVREALQQQRRMFVELLGQDTAAIAPTAPPPRPRSALRATSAMV